MHFLILALERGYIRSVDEPVAEWEPRLRTLNPNLGTRAERPHVAGRGRRAAAPSGSGARSACGAGRGRARLWGLTGARVWGLTEQGLRACCLSLAELPRVGLVRQASRTATSSASGLP